MRRIIIAILALVFILTGSVMAMANESPSVFINGKQLSSPNPPVIENGRTLVPLRAIFEALNQPLNWNASDKSITSGNIWLQIDNSVAKAGDKQIKLDVPAKLINDRTYVPLRFVAESLGKDVKWDGATKKIDILDKPAAQEPAKPATQEPAKPAAQEPAKPAAQTVEKENPSLDFKLTSAYYEEGSLKAKGTFVNTGNVKITTVKRVDIKIFLANNQGDSKMVADEYFNNMPVNINPGESDEYIFTFTGVPVYVDATRWWSEEYDWEFEYISKN